MKNDSTIKDEGAHVVLETPYNVDAPSDDCQAGGLGLTPEQVREQYPDQVRAVLEQELRAYQEIHAYALTRETLARARDDAEGTAESQAEARRAIDATKAAREPMHKAREALAAFYIERAANGARIIAAKLAVDSADKPLHIFARGRLRISAESADDAAEIRTESDDDTPSYGPWIQWPDDKRVSVHDPQTLIGLPRETNTCAEWASMYGRGLAWTADQEREPKKEKG